MAPVAIPRQPLAVEVEEELRAPRPETNTRPKEPNSRPDARVTLSEGGAGGYLATYLAVVACAIDLCLSVRL